MKSETRPSCLFPTLGGVFKGETQSYCILLPPSPFPVLKFTDMQYSTTNTCYFATPTSTSTTKPFPSPTSLCTSSPVPASSPNYNPEYVSLIPPPLPKRTTTQMDSPPPLPKRTTTILNTPPPPYQEQPPPNHAYPCQPHLTAHPYTRIHLELFSGPSSISS